MKNLDYIVAKSSKLLCDPKVQRQIGAAGAAAAVAAKGVIVAAAPYALPVAGGIALGYGAMRGLCWVADKAFKKG